VALTPDGRRAVSASMDETLRVWDLESGTCSIVCRVDGPVACVALTSQVPRVVAGVDKEVRFFGLLSLPAN
jgi:WD40 repeat protein